MTGVHNLTQDEAAGRARSIDVLDYDIALDLTGEETFRSVTTVRFTAFTQTTFLDVAATRLHSVRLNGTDLPDPDWSAANGLRLSDLRPENTLVVDADFAFSRSGQGLHRLVDPADGEAYLYSQFEIADAQRVYACFDQPDLKSVYTWHATVPAHWTVISNARIDRIQQDEDGRTKTVHFQQSATMSTYLTALCAGPYHEVRDEYDGIDLGLFVRASMRRHLDPDDLFLITKQGFEFFHDKFGVRYPLPKYDQVWVPEFNGAAMENFGCVTHGEEYFIFRSQVTDFEYEKRANHMQHELAHMWFGNLVTMRWWDDIWLKEAFAEWASHWCNASNTRFTDAWTTFLTIRKNWGYRQDQQSSTHPVYAPTPDVIQADLNFDAITYAKGASVIKQIVAYVGITDFLAGLRQYFEKHAWGNATFDDLLTALEVASGKELHPLAEQWLETSQVNTLTPVVAVDNGVYQSVVVEQEAPAEHPTLRTHRLALGLYDLHQDQLVRRDRLEVTVAGPRTEIPELTGVRVPDLLLVNDDDLTYAKIRLDPRSLDTVLNHLPGLELSLTRALCWAAAWDLTRDAELAAKDFVRLVCTALPRETDINVVTSALGQVQLTLNQYAVPAWAPAGRQQFADTARATVESAVPGSGLQLAWARAFIASARQPTDLAVLRAWLAGDAVPEGLLVDTELRWNLLSALVAEGAAGAAEIEAEAARDRTANGDRAAATAGALIPTAEAKAGAWRELLSDALPNWKQRAILLGFYHPSQLELTRPYLDEYFAAIDGFWASHDNQIAQEFVTQAYPALLVDQAVVDATDAWLADETHPASARRLVQDARDNQLRALKARSK